MRQAAPSVKNGGNISDGNTTPEEDFTQHNPSPRTLLQGEGVVAWMNKRNICAYQEAVRCLPTGCWCLAEVPEPRGWCKALVWCSQLKGQVNCCDATVSSKPHWWQHSFFLTNSGYIGVHWFLVCC